jgi:hypothetical protein
MRSSLDALQTWFAGQCDGAWEHQYGIKIETLDNPGWAVEIDVTGTRLSGRTLPKVVEERSATDWIHYSAGDGRFRGAGGPRNLTELLERFLAWAEAMP